MSSPKYERLEEDVPRPQNPPPYSENQLYKEPDVPKLPAGPVTPMGYGTTPPEPPPYQPYDGPIGAGPQQSPIRRHPQTVIIRVVEPNEEPDYMAYSIFTMFCCCLFLGSCAVLFSRRTQNANHVGDVVAARKNSKIALILSHTSFGVGLALIILYIIFVMTSSR